MNAFADSLFTALLGWVENAANNVFAFVSGGTSGSFGEWLGEHWLTLVLILCVIGVMTDFAVWMIRWQPWRLWKKRRTDRRERRERRAFERGIKGANGLEMLRFTPEGASAPVP